MQGLAGAGLALLGARDHLHRTLGAFESAHALGRRLGADGQRQQRRSDQKAQGQQGVFHDGTGANNGKRAQYGLSGGPSRLKASAQTDIA